MREELMFAINIDKERERYANESEVKIIKHNPPLVFTDAELKQMGFTFADKKKYRPSNKKPKGSAKPVTINKITYPSMVAASEETGIPLHQITKFTAGKITEKELLLRNAKRLMREEANRAYRESEGS